MSLLPLYIFEFFQYGDLFIRQNLTYEDGPGAERVKGLKTCLTCQPKKYNFTFQLSKLLKYAGLKYRRSKIFKIYKKYTYVNVSGIVWYDCIVGYILRRNLNTISFETRNK